MHHQMQNWIETPNPMNDGCLIWCNHHFHSFKPCRTSYVNSPGVGSMLVCPSKSSRNGIMCTPSLIRTSLGIQWQCPDTQALFSSASADDRRLGIAISADFFFGMPNAVVALNLCVMYLASLFFRLNFEA